MCEWVFWTNLGDIPIQKDLCFSTSRRTVLASSKQNLSWRASSRKTRYIFLIRMLSGILFVNILFSRTRTVASFTSLPHYQSLGPWSKPCAYFWLSWANCMLVKQKVKVCLLSVKATVNQLSVHSSFPGYQLCAKFHCGCLLTVSVLLVHIMHCHASSLFPNNQ